MSHSCIFIVGPGRSGTSLLLSVLASNKRMSALPETQFLRACVFKTTRLITSKDELTERAPKIRRLKHYDSIDESAFPCSARSLYLRVLDAYSENQSDIVVDKDPRLIEWVPALSKYFPMGKILSIRRDPGDILVSKLKADWSRKRHWILNSYVTHLHMRLQDAATEKYGGRVHTLFYESLTASPATCIREVCEFLGIDFDANMLSHDIFAPKNLVSEDELQWKGEVSKPIFANSLNWKGQLTTFQISVVGSLLRYSDTRNIYSCHYSQHLVNSSSFIKIFSRLLADGLNLIAICHVCWLMSRSKVGVGGKPLNI